MALDTNLSAVRVKTVHITQLRTAANAMRAAAGLPLASFTDPVLTAGTLIKRVHITEARTALDAARPALWLLAIVYIDPTITIQNVAAKAAHIAEVRAGTQ